MYRTLQSAGTSHQLAHFAIYNHADATKLSFLYRSLYLCWSFAENLICMLDIISHNIGSQPVHIDAPRIDGSSLPNFMKKGFQLQNYDAMCYVAIHSLSYML